MNIPVGCELFSSFCHFPKWPVLSSNVSLMDHRSPPVFIATSSSLTINQKLHLVIIINHHQSLWGRVCHPCVVRWIPRIWLRLRSSWRFPAWKLGLGNLNWKLKQLKQLNSNWNLFLHWFQFELPKPSNPRSNPWNLITIIQSNPWNPTTQPEPSAPCPDSERNILESSFRHMALRVLKGTEPEKLTAFYQDALVPRVGEP